MNMIGAMLGGWEIVLILAVGTWRTHRRLTNQPPDLPAG